MTAKWTADEVALLREGVGLIDWADMAQAFGRTERAIKEKARRLGCYPRPQDEYTEGELARLLGVRLQTLRSWRRRGWLRTYTDQALRSFARKHQRELDALEEVNLAWLAKVFMAA